MNSRILKLGTRKSLLATAQSRHIARQVEQLNPGVKVELVGIETRGDRILDVPLRAAEGKEFFVAEIDDALKSRAVDFTVHSLKDLSLERPPCFHCAAIPKRANPRDVIVFNSKTIEKLKNGKKISIGTSSPRRLENVPDFLKQALPFAQNTQLDFVEIRGNVNTRLSRIHLDNNDPKYLEGVILAFAGLIRLWNDNDANLEMATLLNGVKWMVLPLDYCPSAPGQGALAVECRADDGFVKDALARLNDKETSIHVSIERQLLGKYGGGCHQRFGATSITHPELENLFFVKGTKESGEPIAELRWNCPMKKPKDGPSFDGSKFRQETKETLPSLPDGNSVFVANARAATNETLSWLSDKRIWTSGTSSWFKLANKGLWVEGCAESLGIEHLLPFFHEKVLNLPIFNDWVVLTHKNATLSWNSEFIAPKTVATYELLGPKDLDTATAKVREATNFFWMSGSQFDQFKAILPGGATHSCGSGKTAQHLRKFGLEPLIFPSTEEWRKWITQ